MAETAAATSALAFLPPLANLTWTDADGVLAAVPPPVDAETAAKSLRRACERSGRP